MTEPWPTLRIGPSMEVGAVQRIAIFRALHLGDFLCSVPALRAIRDRYPRAEVTMIGLPWVRSLLERYPYLDRSLDFPGFEGMEGVDWDRDRSSRFLDEARGYRYDLAIQMHGDGRVSNRFVAQLGARGSMGHRPAGGDHPRRLDLELEWEEGVHEVERWLRLVAVFGAVGTPRMEFPLLPSDLVEMERVAEGEGIDLSRPLIGLHPGGKDPAKRWPVEQFAFVADALAAELSAQVIITGSREETDLAAAVATEMRTGSARLVAGETSLGGLAALLTQLRLLVTNDTGPSHLAAAVGTPSVVLFGPTDPAVWAPLDAECHRALWSGRGAPISEIAPERVVEESLSLVERWAYLTY